APEPLGVARLPLLPARQPARQSRSRNDARVDRGARALPGPRGDGAGAAAAVVAQGAWLHQQGDVKGSGAWARAGRGDPPSQARSLGAGGALAHHRPGGARRAPPHRTAAVPERPDGAALGRAPVGETEPRPQALATAHGGVVGGTVERGYDGGRGGSTPGPCPGVTGNPGLAPGVSETGRLMNRTEALQLMHEHTKSASLRQHMLAVEAAMRAYARQRGEDPETWGIVGLLHDFDYEKFPNPEHSPSEGHPSWGVRLLREQGVPEAMCRWTSTSLSSSRRCVRWKVRSGWAPRPRRWGERLPLPQSGGDPESDRSGRARAADRAEPGDRPRGRGPADRREPSGALPRQPA